MKRRNFKKDIKDLLAGAVLCKHCGSAKHLTLDDMGGYWSVNCRPCGILGPEAATPAQAVREWNEDKRKE